MSRIYSLLLFLVFIGAFGMGCGRFSQSMHRDLGPQEDGVVATLIQDEDEPATYELETEASTEVNSDPTTPEVATTETTEETPAEDSAPLPARRPNPNRATQDSSLTTTPAAITIDDSERAIINGLLPDRIDDVSFQVVRADGDELVKSHLPDESHPLASVTKLATALAALENIRDVNVSEISSMLKSSHNGLASKYIRLAAHSINGTETAGTPFREAHSCPSSTTVERPAARTALTWLKRQANDFSWTTASLVDGAGCSRSNQMTASEVIRLLKHSSSFGKKYNNQSFEDLLSVAGVDGTWSARNRESRGMIFAKTGTLSIASNLAGYFYVSQGEELIKYYFVVLVAKKSADETSASRTLIERLVRHWIRELA